LIQDGAFSGAFKFDSDTTLVLDGNINTIGAGAFTALGNNNNPNPHPFRIQIGSPEHKFSNTTYLKTYGDN
jgi:hypothetical protein